MAELYRKSSLERISSPDQLDTMLKISSPMSWLALAGATLIVVVTLVWAFIGRIPMTVTTTGIVTSPDSTNAVYSNTAGTVTNVFVTQGDKIYEKDVLMEVKTDRNETVQVLSDQVGYVSEIVPQQRSPSPFSQHGQPSGGGMLCSDHGRPEDQARGHRLYLPVCF